MNYKKLLADAKKLDFKNRIQFDYTNSQIIHLERTRLAQYEFTILYDKTIKNHVNSTYLNPEEYDVDFTIKNANELIIYNVKNRILEITYKQNDEILMIIKNKLL